MTRHPPNWATSGPFLPRSHVPVLVISALPLQPLLRGDSPVGNTQGSWALGSIYIFFCIYRKTIIFYFFNFKNYFFFKMKYS